MRPIGKSSLINSLLHFPEIAKTVSLSRSFSPPELISCQGDNGAAITSVVTEYRQKTSEHVAPISIEVEYLTSSEIGEHIRELVWSFRKLYLPGAEDNTISAEDYRECERESEQAWSALEAAFKHRMRFTRTFLSDMSDGAEERIVSQLIDWTHDLDWPGTDGNGRWKANADTAQECCEKTSLFMENRFWPFTKILRYVS